MISVLHPALRLILDELEADDSETDAGVNWVAFLSTDAVITATVREGESRVRIHADFLFDADELTDDEVLEWVNKQPKVHSGVLQAFADEREDGSDYVSPGLMFERPVFG